MMEKIIGIFVCTLMVCSVLVGANSISKNKDGTINVNISVGTYKITKTGQTHEISVENFGRLLIPGKPNLPSKIFSIAIPPGAQFKGIHFETLNSVILPGKYNVPPVPLPRVVGEEKPGVYQHELQVYEKNYKSVYMSDNPYPSSAVEFVQTSGFRKYNLVDVRVNPFTYYPLSGKLVYYPDVKVYVSYTFPEGFSTEDIIVDNIASAEQQAENIVYNYDQAQSWYPNNAIGGRGLYDYVIITLDSLTSSVSSLVDWEETKGHNVNVVTTSWINTQYTGYDLAEKIRNFLRDKYPSNAWGILDVCLVGGYDDVPMRRCWQDTGYGKPETDFYYAELSLTDSQSWDANGNHQYGEDSDPIDFYGEVSVGRIPWSDTETVQSICEKSVAYEQNDDPGFKKNILLLGAFFWPDTDNAVLMEYKTNPDNNPWMSDWTKTRMYEQGYSTYPMDYDLTYNNVKNVWSAGTYAFVDWAGHGSPTECVRYYPSMTDFVNTDTCNYLNNDYPAIIFADACSNSDTDELNIGQSMLKQGGVGFLGATKVAYGMGAWNDPTDGSGQSLDYYFTSCVTSGEYTQGQAHQWSLTKMYTDNLWYYLKYETFEWGALWGNPDLTMGEVILSNPPLTPPKPTGPTQGVINEICTFSTSTTDPDGDQVYYKWNWGDGNISEWIGPYDSGAIAQASYTWVGLGSYLVKVKAKDSWGANGGWSEPLYITIVDNTPPNAPTITGPNTGRIGKTYTFNITATDPNNDNIYYFILWGDGSNSSWIGPYASGEEITQTHTWSKRGTYTVSAKVKDIGEYESSWTHHEIKIILGGGSQPSNNQQIQKLLRRISN
jgi:hypothetical protein